jgi:myo-inositol-1(or 4)-monophosphatase
MSSYQEILDSADAIARKAAATLMSMRDQRLDVTRKEGLDIVTAADLASERIVIDGLRALTPKASILSEEAGTTGSPGDSRWIVDPLDGTINYASGLPWFSVTMAYQEQGTTKVGLTIAPAAGFEARYTNDGVATVNGRPARVSTTAKLADSVVAVVLTSHFSPDEVAQTAEIIRRLGVITRGVRVIVSGAFEYSTVAAGQLDAAVSIKADVVSYAAAMPLLRAAGGRVTTLSGADATDEDRQKIGSNGLIHDELLDALRGL